MYFVFRPEIIEQADEVIEAELVGDTPEYEPFWWKAQPLKTQLDNLTFWVNSGKPYFDNYYMSMEFDLYSSKLVNLLRGDDIKFEVFPVIVKDKKSKKTLSQEYHLFHLLEAFPALTSPPEKNQVYVDPNMEFSEQAAKLVNKNAPLKLSEECLKKEKPLFRMKEQLNLVLIHQNLKTTLEANHITGCTFTPIEKFRAKVLKV